MKQDLPIIEVPADGKPNWLEGAFTIAFVFSKNGNFIVKGYRREVVNYLKKNHTHYFVKYTLWYKGEQRTIWGFWKENIGVYQEDRRQKRSRKKIRCPFEVYEKTWMTAKKNPIKLKFRRPLTRWIPELNGL